MYMFILTKDMLFDSASTKFPLKLHLHPLQGTAPGSAQTRTRQHAGSLEVIEELAPPAGGKIYRPEITAQDSAPSRRALIKVCPCGRSRGSRCCGNKPISCPSAMVALRLLIQVKVVPTTLTPPKGSGGRQPRTPIKL
jgi:hypothetical protein